MLSGNAEPASGLLPENLSAYSMLANSNLSIMKNVNPVFLHSEKGFLFSSTECDSSIVSGLIITPSGVVFISVTIHF